MGGAGRACQLALPTPGAPGCWAAMGELAAEVSSPKGAQAWPVPASAEREHPAMFLCLELSPIFCTAPGQVFLFER